MTEPIDVPRTTEDLDKYDLSTRMDTDYASAIKAAVEVQMKHPELDIWKYLAECDFRSNTDLWYKIYETLQKNTGYNPSGVQLSYLKGFMKNVGIIGMSALRKTSSASSAPKGGRKSSKSKHLRMKLKRTRSKKIKKCSRRSRRSRRS